MTRAGLRKFGLVAAAVVVLGGGVAAAMAAADSGPPAGEAAPHPAPGASSSPPPMVIIPGRPGEPNITVPADEAKAPDGTEYNAMDAWFLRMMIPHHVQAVEMAALAPTRAGNRQVRALAERIAVAQPGEIAQMRAWLSARGLKEDLSAHDHGTMRGMQSPAKMRALAAARGDSFDKQFVAMMSEHHQGAVDMATDLLKVGKDVQVEKLATAIAVEQSVEIDRMRDALAARPG